MWRSGRSPSRSIGGSRTRSRRCKTRPAGRSHTRTRRRSGSGCPDAIRDALDEEDEDDDEDDQDELVG
jgi:hypothetical protein